MKQRSEFISIEIANGGFILEYQAEVDTDRNTESVREVVPTQRKLVNRLKELIAEKSLVGAEEK
jgi:hypothetical protein